ncbi:DegT/DnrJ/EryC1/StrS family aminotransferase [Streptomyces anulatus]|uniref:DegT/DnrJ/EryC1/StrS family aminotransferase n=1 Tax=Streptomyces anulatus TaxID=1892 RepID=UPI003B7DDABE
MHQWGHPCAMDAILQIAERHGLRVLEDCSRAHGSRYRASSSRATPRCMTAPRSSGNYRDRSRDAVLDEALRNSPSRGASDYAGSRGRAVVRAGSA